MTSSMRAAAVLLLVLSLAVGCGDDDGSTTTAREDVPRPSAPRPDPAAPSNEEEYPGAFGDAKDLCGISSRRKVAEIVDSRSTRPEAIARAVAEDYRPHLRRAAYRGCLAALR
jgi:hypothetical protein